jgi:hypothetical protein
MYDQLKQQVQHLKLDQQELQATKTKQKEVTPSSCGQRFRLSKGAATLLLMLNQALIHVSQLETVALLQQKLQYEQQLDKQQQEILALQTRLKDSTERASKLRQHFEK